MQESLMSGTDTLSSSFTIHPFHILQRGSAASFFEPVVSVPRRGVVGLETHGRVVNPANLRLVKPQDLFGTMQEEDFYLKLGLDSLLRQKGLESFTPFRIQKPNLLLFLDIEPSILEENIVSSGYLLKQVEEYQFDPRQVIMQIPLSDKMDPRLVEHFIKVSRGQGFLIGLKEVNAAPKRLSQIFTFDPDLIKLDNRMVRGLARQTEKRAAFREVAKLAHALGVVVVAGNMDNEEDALGALELGADLLQGKYFSKEYPKSRVLTLGRKARMIFLTDRFNRQLHHRAFRDREKMARCEKTGEIIFSYLENNRTLDLEAVLNPLSRLIPALECLYRLDTGGIQVGPIARSQYHIPERKQFLFEASPEGTNHSFREYYYGLSNLSGSTLTEPYLSLNSGHFCVTVAKCITDISGGDIQILCADLNLSKV